MMAKLVGLSGSLRERSFNTALLHAAAEVAPAGTDVSVHTFKGWPIYDADDQASTGIPAAVDAMAEEIRAADGVLIASPEYNYSIPGGLKNGIDWLSRVKNQPFAGKAVAILGASPGRLGTARMQYHLRQVFVFLDGRILNKPEVMVGGAAQLFDDNLVLTDKVTRGFIADQVSALLAAAGKA